MVTDKDKKSVKYDQAVQIEKQTATAMNVPTVHAGNLSMR
jgi:hypothetical protein